MRFQTLAAIAVGQTALAANYLNLATIKNLYTAGASIDWYGSPGYNYSNTANGPNHIEYLSYGRNWNIRKYAYPGAVTDPTIVPALTLSFGFPAPIINWNLQIENVKAAFNSDKGAPTSATGANSLFVLSASNTGNDIFSSWNKTQGAQGTNRTNTIGALVNRIGTGLNQIYALGGRNFIIFSVLPVHKTPLIQSYGTAAINSVQAYYQEYNTALKNVATYLQGAYPDANIYFPDISQRFADVQSGAVTTGPTAGYTIRNNYCEGVKNDSVGLLNPRNPNYNNCAFGARGRQFLFWDEIHFTSPLHCEYVYQTLFSLVGYNAVYPANCQYAAGTN